MDELRRLLKQPDCSRRVIELLKKRDADRRLAQLFIPHVREVFRRADAVIGSESEKLWFLKLAVLVHEVGVTRLPELLDQIGFGDVERPVLEVVGSFGEVWTSAPEAVSAYVHSHNQHLRALLMFELAHEGQATNAMIAAARLGGFAEDFARWRQILRDL